MVSDGGAAGQVRRPEVSGSSPETFLQGGNSGSRRFESGPLESRWTRYSSIQRRGSGGRTALGFLSLSRHQKGYGQAVRQRTAGLSSVAFHTSTPKHLSALLGQTCRRRISCQQDSQADERLHDPRQLFLVDGLDTQIQTC